MSLNIPDIRSAVTAAKEELVTLRNDEGKKDGELLKIKQRIGSLDAFVTSAQALLNSSPTGVDISAIGGHKAIV